MTVLKSFSRFFGVLACVGALALPGDRAEAASLAEFAPVAGGARINGSGLFLLGSHLISMNTATGVATGGSLAAPQNVTGLTADFILSGGQVVAGGLTSLSQMAGHFFPSLFLMADFEDMRSTAGKLSFLLSVSPIGSHHAAFGSHVIVTLENALFNAQTLDNRPGAFDSLQSYTAGFSVAEAGFVPVPPPATAPVPLPGGLLMLLSAWVAGWGLIRSVQARDVRTRWRATSMKACA